MVQAGRRAQDPGPDLGRVAGIEGAGGGGDVRRIGLARRRAGRLPASLAAAAEPGTVAWRVAAASPPVAVPLEPGEVRGEPLGEPRREPAQTLAERPPNPPSGTRNSLAGRRVAVFAGPTVRWSVGSNRRSESISSPKNSSRTGSDSPGGKTSTIPPRRANSPRPATSIVGW